jgi:predicted enzyme related to lactoylglutathione lyase
MRLASTYLYVSDMGMESSFWQTIFEKAPVSSGEKWTEFAVGDVRVGLLLDDESIGPVNSTSVLVFEVEDGEMDEYIARTQAAGGSIVMQGLSSRIIMASPSGHQFEFVLTKPARSAA